MVSEAMSPRKIYDFLRQDIVGQDDVLRFVSVSIAKHLLEEKFGNLLLIGNSGTGKTSIMKAVERFYEETPSLEIHRTVLRINANLLYSEAGAAFPGETLFRELKDLVLASLPPEKHTPQEIATRLEHATICIDEIDKISAVLADKPYPPGIAIQQSLLTLMEGERSFFSLTLQGREETLSLDTSKMLFICGGAFERLYDLVFYRAVVKEKEQTTKVNLLEDGRIAFEYQFSLKDYMRQEDLFAYGMLPQFLSRFDNILILNDLTTEDLQYIFAKPRDSLYQLSARYFKKYGIQLVITDNAQKKIAEESAKYKRIGARALKDVYGKLIKPYEFDPLAFDELHERNGQQELVIDEETVNEYLKSKR